MTAEVCLLNRYAAVLAADSATTASHWDEDKQQRVERYFKGANKVFQLSSRHPVGLMIYGNASLHSVPWEVLVKEFRASIKEQAFAEPKHYADAFFDFLRSSQWLFETGIIDGHFVYNATVSALSVLWEADKAPSVTGASTDAAKTAAVRAIFASRNAQAAAMPLPAIFTTNDVAAAQQACAAQVVSNIAAYLGHWSIPNDLTAAELATFGIEGLFKTYRQSLSDHLTGIVVAGFGEKQVFPSFAEYECFGFVRSTLAIDTGESGSVTHAFPAHMRAYAQRSMVDTLRTGFSVDLLNSIHSTLQDALRSHAAEIQAAVAAPNIPGLDVLTKAATDSFFQGLLSYSKKAHQDPLNRVIGHLPVAEMAQLAETLVSLQSLKERVTQPSESVGGPVDVAVITRSEGLVWIKRKHYFDPSLNPRFLARMHGFQ